MTTDIIKSEEKPLLDLELLKKTLANRIVLLNEALKEMSQQKKANSKVGEVFNLILVELQSVKDYGSFLEMSDKLAKFDIDSVLSEEDKSKMYELEAKMNAHKLWFMKFNNQALDSYARMNDRKARERDDDKPLKIPLPQIHQLMREAKIVEAEFKDGD